MQKTSAYAVWTSDLYHLGAYLWVSLHADSPTIVRVDQHSHDALLASSGEVENFSPSVFGALLKYGILVDENAAELSDLLRHNQQKTFESDILRRTIMPSGDCPLGCGTSPLGGYCGQTHSANRLNLSSLPHLKADLQQHFGTGQFHRFDLGFTGAEPLMNVEFVYAYLEMVQDLCSSYSISLDQAVLVTSGVLINQSVALNLATRGLTDVEITLDGTKEFHDKRRLLKSGAASFDRIYGNLLEIAECEALNRLNITIRMNVDIRNYKSTLDLMDKLETSGLLSRCAFYIAPVRNWGELNAGEQHSDRKVFAALEMRVLRRLVKLGHDPNLIPQRKFNTCAATNPYSIVVDPFGQVHACTETPLTHSKLPLVDIDKPWHNHWPAFLASKKFPCSECKFLPVCGGKCPKDWLLGYTPCPSFVDNMSDRLNLATVLDANVVDLMSHETPGTATKA